MPAGHEVEFDVNHVTRFTTQNIKSDKKYRLKDMYYFSIYILRRPLCQHKINVIYI